MSTASGISGASPAPTAPPEDSRSAIELNNPKPVPRPGTWISAAIVAVLGAMLLNSLITNDKFHWDTVWFFLREVRVIAAVGWTLLLTFMAMGIGIVLAVTTAIMRQSSNPVLRVMSLVYLWFFRGTPIYTQLVFWGALSALYQHLSLGVPFGPELLTFKTTTVFTPFVAAVLGLGINEGAYLSEIVRSGLNSVDKGQSEAARALGMGKGQILRRIIIPQAMRVIVPPTGNETISMLKTTSLVLAVPFTLDLTFVTNSYASWTYQTIPLLLVAAIWYIIITSILMVCQHYIERYYGRGFDSQGHSGRGTKRSLSTRQQAILDAHTTKDDPFLEYTP
ncbi:amino acid ABC transporter permease [Actinomyces capricornis]|uniref:ABC transporter permease n=1 Tax=Actinomyces capricornis TaxID=2755559 RepID=A0ABN6K8H6_9ACTO|nr:amino acid ABC transporter permease [Actinomyces capricornis]BDA65623.1 ABC transporter permease [Actinomyces capricornis]